MRNIRVDFIPHSAQRYPTVGDWRETNEGETWKIDVSMMSDWRYGYLVAMHELIEMALCKHRGISEQAVTDFDLDFEAKRPDGCDDEPGGAQDAPYREEHLFAEAIERRLAAELGVDWPAYDQEVTNL